MRIGIDFLPALSHAPGVGRYARELTRALARLDDVDMRLLEWGTEPRVMPEASLGLTGRERRRRVTLPRRVLRAAATFGLGADRLLGGTDVFHQVLWRRPLPVSRAIQTIGLGELPDFGGADEDRLRSLLADMAAVFVFSSRAAAAVETRFDLPSERVVRVPVGADHWARELSELPAPVEPARVLVLGSSRPGMATLAEACERLRGRGRDCRLMVVLPSGHAYSELRARLGKAEWIESIEWSRPVEEALPNLVAGASVLVHLDPTELTPVTPLEGLACGVPVVVDRNEVFEEALGATATYVELEDDAIDVDDLADAVASAIEARGDANAVSARRRLASGFTWEHCARKTLQTWRHVVVSRTQGSNGASPQGHGAGGT